MIPTNCDENDFNHTSLERLWQRIKKIKSGIKPECLSPKKIQPSVMLASEKIDKERLALSLKHINQQIRKEEINRVKNDKENKGLNDVMLAANSISIEISPKSMAKSPEMLIYIPSSYEASTNKKNPSFKSIYKNYKIINNANKNREDRNPSDDKLHNQRTSDNTLFIDNVRLGKTFAKMKTNCVKNKEQIVKFPFEEESLSDEIDEFEFKDKNTIKYDVEMAPGALLNVHDLMCDFRGSNMYQKDPYFSDHKKSIKPSLTLRCIKAMIKPKRSNGNIQTCEQIRNLGQYREKFMIMLDDFLVYIPKSDDNINYVANREFKRYAESVFENIDIITDTNLMEIATTSKTFDFVTSPMESLIKIRDEITQHCGPDKALTYIDLVLKWLHEELDFDSFDIKGQQIIPSHLHTDFFIAITEIFQIDLKSHREHSRKVVVKKRKLTSEEFLVTKTDEDMPIAQKRKKEVMPNKINSTVQEYANLSQFHSNLLHPDVIQAKACLYAWKNGLERIEEDAASLVYQEVRTMVASLLQATLRTVRSHLMTDYGFIHSFGQKRVNVNRLTHISKQTKAPGIIRAIWPSREPICAQDLLDSIEVDDVDIKLPLDMKRKLISRLETVPNPPRRVVKTERKTEVPGNDPEPQSQDTTASVNQKVET